MQQEKQETFQQAIRRLAGVIDANSQANPYSRGTIDASDFKKAERLVYGVSLHVSRSGRTSHWRLFLRLERPKEEAYKEPTDPDQAVDDNVMAAFSEWLQHSTDKSVELNSIGRKVNGRTLFVITSRPYPQSSTDARIGSMYFPFKPI
ncbi:hypothetical protein DACRYDRAFT_21369, partial [Dacryopinax primogenitus]